jgi:DNA-binding transcriptional MerR regulator
MINLEDEVYIAPNTYSCSKDEAIAKLLGWMQGTKRLKFINVSRENGFALDELPHLHSLDTSIFEFLSDQINTLINARIDLAEQAVAATDESEKQRLYGQINQKEDDISLWNQYAERAADYLNDIEEELRRAELSELKFDQNKSTPDGDPYIVLRSLSEWSKKKYSEKIEFAGTSVFDSKKIVDKSNESSSIRTDYMREEILKILQTKPNAKAAYVMSELKLNANTQGSCVLRDEGDGVKWDDGGEEPRVLKMPALRERLRLIKRDNILEKYK